MHNDHLNDLTDDPGPDEPTLDPMNAKDSDEEKKLEPESGSESGPTLEGRVQEVMRRVGAALERGLETLNIPGREGRPLPFVLVVFSPAGVNEDGNTRERVLCSSNLPREVAVRALDSAAKVSTGEPDPSEPDPGED